MPEGDTVFRTAARLHAALAGAPLVLSDLRWPSLATADLVAATTTEVVPRGKHILQRLDRGLTLHSHLRMEGQWRVARPGPETSRLLRRADLRAAVGTAVWTAAGLRLGMLDLVPTAREGDLVGHLGPDVLGPDWDAAAATAAVTAYPRTVGEALLDQRTLAGVGTYWASEGLFLERVLPWTPAAQVPPEGAERVVERIHRLMTVAKDSAVQSSTGSHRAGETSYVHGRSGRPCRRCGDTVRVALLGAEPRARTMFSCPTCQGGWAPTDDRGPQRPLGSGRAPTSGRQRDGGRGGAGAGAGFRPRTG
ncbi:MAG TPA: DNA-formamidopyrimidine glycosylase family protein [Dermatophilaceae bacterium]|nr:DNA-formamidopyrimidine glycosylase family protein [Dermatophilaceae bacterium]